LIGATVDGILDARHKPSRCRDALEIGVDIRPPHPHAQRCSWPEASPETIKIKIEAGAHSMFPPLPTLRAGVHKGFCTVGVTVDVTVDVEKIAGFQQWTLNLSGNVM